jgi:hypothetical protein
MDGTAAVAALGLGSSLLNVSRAVASKGMELNWLHQGESNCSYQEMH